MDNPNPGPIYPMSKYLLFNLIQPAVQNAAWISENSACMMYTSKQFNEFIKCKKIYCLLVPRLLFAGGEAASGGGGVASKAPSPTAPSSSLPGDPDGSRRGQTSPSLRPSPLCCASRGGSMLRRNFSASGTVASQLHWLLCNQTPPSSTGTVSPATP